MSQQEEPIYQIVPHKRQRTTNNHLAVSNSPDPLFEIPPAISSMIKTHAYKTAIKWCQKEKTCLEASELEDCKTNGRIPKKFTSKFKNVFTSDGEAALRTATVELVIDQEITRLSAIHAEIENELSNAITVLSNELRPILTACRLELDPQILQQEFDYQVQCTKSKFLIRQQADAKLKAQKEAKHLLHKEAQAEVITMTKKEKSKMEAQIKSLQKDLATLKVKVSSGKKPGKGHGSAQKSPKAGPPNPKKDQKGSSTKATKRKDGNKPNIVKANRSRG